MIYTPDNLKVCFAAPLEFYASWRDELGAAGFHTLSLSLAGPAAAPIYTAVMVKPAQPSTGRSWARLSADELRQKVAELKAATPALHPYIISATGSGNAIVYAACFREMARAPACDLWMTAEGYADKCAEQRGKNRRLLWVDAFGTAGQILYCAVWGDNPENAGWNAEAVNDKGAFAEQRHDVLRSVGARPVHVALTPDGGRTKLYVDTQPVHSWFSAGLMSADRMQDVCAEQAADDRQPVSIGTAVLEGGLHYAAIFAKSDEVVPRTFRVRGPTPRWASGDDATRGAAIDQWVHDHLKGHGRRGAALAIVQGTRLVYAKGYTYAEPDVHNIEPTTVFRLASVSKALCAAAVWKALIDSPRNRNSTLQSILQLKTPDGGTPKGNFDKITLRHLLECRSGIPQASMRDAMAKIKESHASGTQPASVATLAREVASAGTIMTDDEATNGGAATKYGKTDYWLLGQVAARLCGAADFDAALKKLVLDPLQMKLTTSSSSRFDPEATNLPMYHRQDIATAESAIDDKRRLVPAQYGSENYAVFDGAGGVSSAVVDVARLCAMYSCRSGNPVFSSSWLDEMFDDAIAAATRADAEKNALPENERDDFHGCYHGFGAAQRKNSGVYLAKGGDLPAVETDFAGTTGGLFIVFLRNGDPKPDAGLPAWNSAVNGLRSIAEDISWTEDLFPTFKMTEL